MGRSSWTLVWSSGLRRRLQSPSSDCTGDRVEYAGYTLLCLPSPYFGVSGRKFCANKSLLSSACAYFCLIAYFCSSFLTFSVFKHRFCTGRESCCHVAMETLSGVLAPASPAGWRTLSLPHEAQMSERQDRREGAGPRAHTVPSSPATVPLLSPSGASDGSMLMQSQRVLSPGSLSLPTWGLVFGGPRTTPTSNTN